MATLFNIRAANVQGAVKHWQHIKEALITNIHTLTSEEKDEARRVYQEYNERFNTSFTCTIT